MLVSQDVGDKTPHTLILVMSVARCKRAVPPAYLLKDYTINQSTDLAPSPVPGNTSSAASNESKKRNPGPMAQAGKGSYFCKTRSITFLTGSIPSLVSDVSANKIGRPSVY